MKLFQAIIEKIQSLSKPTIVAISGFGGVGKSTTADALAKLLTRVA